MSIKVSIGMAAVAASIVFAAAPQPVLEAVIVCAVAISWLAMRALQRPALDLPATSAETLAAAKTIVDRHGEDSLSPFIVRPDKTFEFAAGAVAAYQVIGETAVVSGDPVGPDGALPEVLGRVRATARARGLKLVIYGGSDRRLDLYRRLGLRTMCVGEEAVVDPRRFTLEGRPVRKLRQSVTRIGSRGWAISAVAGNEIAPALRAEMSAVEARWRAEHDRIVGFAMSMGEFDPGVQPHDLYLLARSPEGQLQAVMRFISHRGKLSLDTMRRVGETPNGLNEALVCRALEVARKRGITEVSLNYAGLGHLIRRGPRGNRLVQHLTRWALGLLSRYFQMERLVRFNEKFSPQWRPRYLVYESRTQLVMSAFRVLQAEGYLPQRRRLALRFSRGAARKPLDGLVSELGPVRWKATR